MRAGDPRYVLLTGAAGIGKSALIRRFLDGVDDLRVLRSGGVQEEQSLPYGVVAQLARSARVSLPERLAVLAARSSARSPEPPVIGADLIELLGHLPGPGPVAMIVDDAQWADRPSLLALLFAMRRLHADRVLVLLVAREDDVGDLPEGLVRLTSGERGAILRLSGLTTDEVQELAAVVTHRQLPAQAAERLREHTGGSPLHSLALLEELPLERLSRTADSPLPSPRSFSLQVLSRLAHCPLDAHRLVIAASILGQKSSLVLAQRLAGVDDALAALEGAMSARLLEPCDLEEGPGLAFPHALTRAAIYHDITPVRRAGLHRRAAELAGDEAASLQHRSAAALAEDDHLAAELADYARREVARGAWARAAEAMFRASRLSSAREHRERRLLEGVDCLLSGGDLTEALAHTATIRALPDGAHRRHVDGRLAFHTGRPIDGQRLLLGAWELCDPARDRELAGRIATEVALVLVRRARAEELVMWARRAIALAEGAVLTRAPWSHLAYGLAYAGRADDGLAEITFGDLDTAGDLGAQGVEKLYARGLLRFITDDLAGAHADFAAAEPAAAQWGPFRFRVSSLAFLSAVEYRLGAWDDAIAHGELGASIGEDADQTWMLTWLHAVATAPLAGRGDWEAAEAHAAAAVRYARIVGDEAGIADGALATAQIAAARGDHGAVVEALEPVRRMPEREGIDEPGARWPWREHLADALVGLGRLDEAQAVLEPFEEVAHARRRRSSIANALRVRGNLEAARRSPDAAEAAFVDGLEHAQAVSIPFDRARLHAAYGRLLRRAGRRRAAVAQLTEAKARFAQLGAQPYLQACEHELAVCGIATSGRHDRGPARLTPQEISIARLVAKGLSNREVATEAVVSVNTVEYHLKNIFAKLGVSSRHQLAAQLDAT